MNTEIAASNLIEANAAVNLKKEAKRAYDKLYYQKHAERICARTTSHAKANLEKTRERIVTWYKTNREERRAYYKSYYLKNSKSICARTTANRKANPEKYRAIASAWNRANQEKLRVQKAAWRNANREKWLSKSGAYYKANRERLLPIRRKWRKENAAKVKSDRATRYRANIEKEKARNAAWYRKNPERMRELNDAWIEANPEKFKVSQRICAARRRARKLSNSTPEQISAADAKITQMLSQPKTLCTYCSKEFQTAEMHVEHILALLRGGAHSAENICMACEDCNCSKRAKLLHIEWQPPNPLLYLMKRQGLLGAVAPEEMSAPDAT